MKKKKLKYFHIFKMLTIFETINKKKNLWFLIYFKIKY